LLPSWLAAQMGQMGVGSSHRWPSPGESAVPVEVATTATAVASETAAPHTHTSEGSTGCAARPSGPPTCQDSVPGPSAMLSTAKQDEPSLNEGKTPGNPSPGGAALLDFVEEVRALERRRAESMGRAAEALQVLVGPKVRLVKSASVDGRLLFVIDGAVPEEVCSDLFECLQNDAFRRTEFARPDTWEFRHHVVEYNLGKLRHTALFSLVGRLVKLLFPGTTLEAYRIYTNAVMFGDAAFVHRDSDQRTHVTALVYPNPEWSSELGGETIFYDESGEIVEAVEPRPGRLCLFHGSILHKGSPPSRLFWGSRYTTAFKFAPEAPVGKPTLT